MSNPWENFEIKKTPTTQTDKNANKKVEKPTVLVVNQEKPIKSAQQDQKPKPPASNENKKKVQLKKPQDIKSFDPKEFASLPSSEHTGEIAQPALEKAQTAEMHTAQEKKVQTNKTLQTKTEKEDLKLKHPPNPKRFADFKELPGRRFQIKDGNIYNYDKYNGWHDEFGNYYNHKGDPSRAPSLSRSRSSSYSDRDSKSHSYHEDFEDDLLDKYVDEPEFQGVNEETQELERETQRISRMQKLLKRLDLYHSHEEVKIYFSNIDFKARHHDVKQFFCAKDPQIQIKYVHMNENEQKIRNGTGYIQTDKQSAEKILEFEGLEVNVKSYPRRIRFQIDGDEVDEDDFES